MPSELPGQSPLEPEILSLLERERSDPYGDAAGIRKAALARRLEHAALALAVTSTAPLLGAAAEAARRALAPSVASQTKRLLAWGLASKIGAASLLVAGGAITGAMLEAHYDATARPPAPAISAPARGAAPAIGAATARSEDTSEPAIPSVDIDSLPSIAPRVAANRAPAEAASFAAPAASAHAPTTSMGEELILLDTARAAVARGAYSAALATLTDHADRFPQGKHAEERELLFVQALAGAGRNAEAAARAHAFEAKFPGSIFLPAVRAASSTKEP